jgi:hypothetical protein
MARGHGRILTSIWDDADFTSLGEEEQRLYFFLLSQTNLNHAGLLPVTLLRWSRKAKGLTPALLSDRLGVLEGARFVVVDPETEELLIRSYVRNDGVWKQPNVMAAMVSASQEIESPTLRRVLLAEMDRLPLDLLSDETSSRGGPSTRQQIEVHLTNLRRLLVVPDPVPPHPSSIPTEDPSANPFGRVLGTPPDTIGEPSTRAGAPAYTRAAPSPSPVPYPSPEKDVAAPVVELRLVPDHAEPAQPAAGKPAPRRSTPAPDAVTITDAMRVWAVEKGVASDRIGRETERFLDHHRANGKTFKDWNAAWRTWISRAADYVPRQATGTGGYQGPYQAPRDTDYAQQGGF